MLGAGTDDKTSYHPDFDFCGKERADRPDCLFFFQQPPTRRNDRHRTYLVWNGRVVLDYASVPVRIANLPLTISSKIGQEEARLEAMLRLNSNTVWEDILARILRRGDDKKKARRVRSALNMRLVRFRIIARLISWDQAHHSKVLKMHLLTFMTAEEVVKNTTKGLSDLARGSGQLSLIELLNAGSSNAKGQAQCSDKSKERKSKKEQDLEKKRKEERTKRAKDKFRRADEWTQARSTWEARNPIPAPSIYGETKCSAIESIVAFKLASLIQHRCDGSEVYKGWFTTDHAAPVYQFDNARMEEFFGSQAYYHDNALLLQNPNDPYGLLSSPTITAAQTCIVDFLLEPARLQYREATLVDEGSGECRPIVMTNPSDSYWQQLQTLQSAFEQHWTELGRGEHPPVLHGLLKLDYDTLTWNTNEAPALTLVWKYIDSCTKTFFNWQRRRTEHEREKLLQRHRDLDDEAESRGERRNGDNQDGLGLEEEEGGKDDVEVEEGAGVEEGFMEVESEGEEEL